VKGVLLFIGVVDAAVLGASGLNRLRRASLEPTIGREDRFPTILSGPPFTQFDALFFWED